MRIDVSRLVDAYYDAARDPSDAAQRVRFGTSGHRGSAFLGVFNEAHVLAMLARTGADPGQDFHAPAAQLGETHYAPLRHVRGRA